MKHSLTANRRWIRLAAACIAAALVVILLAAAYSTRPGVELATLTTDPVAVGKIPAYTGVVSNIGILILWATAVTCIALGLVLRQARAADWRPLVVGGALLALLAIDDLFLLHERGAPAIGISDSAYAPVYALAAIAFAVWARDFLKASAWPVIALGVGALALSLLLDLASNSTSGLEYLLEDGLKLVGFLLVGGFFAHAAATRIAAVLRSPRMVVTAAAPTNAEEMPPVPR